MPVKRITVAVSALSMLLSSTLSSGIAYAASETVKTSEPILSLEEIQNKRQAVRDELMLPSLVGIKSIAYRVIGFKNFEPLQNAMAARLKKMDIRTESLLQMKADTICDALVQITFVKTGAHTIGELKVTQWVSLDRDPRIHLRAVTYSEKAYVSGNKTEQAIEQLTDRFVADFTKANQSSFVIPHMDKKNSKSKSKKSK